MSQKRKFQRVLIANRGEIALRIIRTLRDMGLESVAVYSEADKDSSHRMMADYAVCLKGNLSSETYLDQDKILAAMKASGATALHPGYGFLSENAAFAAAVTEAGYTFIGPSAKSMGLLGDKVQAKKLMIENDIPVTPGSRGGLSTLEELQELVEEMGFPLILKAAAGGGGRGMRVVRQKSDLSEAFLGCQREALSYFGNPEIFAERFVENPRHIEVQVLCDSHGQGFHLNERDCSVQRRHQKLIEEAPSLYLDDKKRRALGEIAVKAALAAGYEGVGTVEFICESKEKIYFMEMNTRIQVEHTVTEEITRTDLIHQQVLVALGEKLTLKQEALEPQGWSIECRINAEDAPKGFVPNPGKITKLRLPMGPSVRVDSHIYEGYTIPAHYDSMIAKVIVWGPDREAAVARMLRALGELVIEGIPTTARFHEAVLKHPLFVAGDLNTGFVESEFENLKAKMVADDAAGDPLAAVLAAIKVQDAKFQRPLVGGAEGSKWQEASRVEAIGAKV